MIGLEFGIKHELVEKGRLHSGGSYKDICIKSSSYFQTTEQCLNESQMFSQFC